MHLESLVSLLCKKRGLDFIYLVTSCGRALKSVIPRMPRLRQGASNVKCGVPREAGREGARLEHAPWVHGRN